MFCEENYIKNAQGLSRSGFLSYITPLVIPLLFKESPAPQGL